MTKHPRLPRDAAISAIVCALIVALAALQFALPLRSDDAFMGDTIYDELGRSLFETGAYGVDYHDVLYPPGVSGLLALECVIADCGHLVFVRSMAIYLALALLASYWLLKRVEGTAFAAIACLLIGSSPIVFALSTHGVSSDLPYFLASISTLLLALALDQIDGPPWRVRLLGAACALMLVVSVLIRSSGVALIAGLAAWLTIGAWWASKAARARRWRKFAGVLVAGILVQAAWMTWVARHETVEWPMLEGHPRTYLSQLVVKDGLRPELGPASLAEVALRVPKNLVERTAGLVQIVTRKDYIQAAWYSPLVFVPVTLIAIGLGLSLRSAGGTLMEWYFMAHETMYLVWPWPFEARFLLPVAPLALLYLWRGATGIARASLGRPRAVGAVAMLVGLPAAATAATAGWASGSMQPKLAAVFWISLLVVGFWMMLPSRSGFALERLRDRFHRQEPGSTSGRAAGLLKVVGAVAAGSLIALGIAHQIEVGRRNRSFDLSQHPSYGRILAARWIAEHTQSSAVVMASQLDVVHHYSDRKVVWFPPLSSPHVLMEGIRRLGADFIVVTKHWTYFLPSEQESAAVLLQAYPASFRVVKDDARFSVLEVIREPRSDTTVRRDPPTGSAR